MSEWSGAAVKKARAYWADRLPQPCSRCGKPVTREQRWQVDHWPIGRAEAKLRGMSLRDLPTWPAHGHCNESSGGKEGAARTNAQRRATKAQSQPRRDFGPDYARGIRGVA